MILPALSGICLFLLLVVLIQGIRIGSLNRRYKAFTALTGEMNIEKVLIANQNQIKEILKHQESQDKNIESIYGNLKLTFEKIGIVKYNAFDGMGGQMSAVIVLLNKNLDGVLLNSIHSREGSHLYTKAISNGKTEQILSNEEEAALTAALYN